MGDEPNASRLKKRRQSLTRTRRIGLLSPVLCIEREPIGRRRDFASGQRRRRELNAYWTSDSSRRRCEQCSRDDLVLWIAQGQQRSDHDALLAGIHIRRATPSAEELPRVGL